MDVDLGELWKKLHLTEEEEEEFTIPHEVLDEEAEWIPNCLLGGLLTMKSFNKEAFKNTMTRIWRGTPVMKVFEVGENLFLFQFKSAEEREVVINGGPWNFDDNLVVLKALEPGDRPGKELLTKAAFWIQIYGLPFSSMTEKMGLFMGQKLGRVWEVKTDEQGLGLGNCLAIKVEIDVRKPLRRRMKILISKEVSVTVDLKYERLPEFCFGCGIMGHKERECVDTIKLRKANPSLPWQYGKWLKAPVRQWDKFGSWLGSRMGQKPRRKEEFRQIKGVWSDSGSHERGKEEECGSHTTSSEEVSVEPTSSRGLSIPSGVGLEVSPTKSVDGIRRVAEVRKFAKESSQPHGRENVGKTSGRTGESPVFSLGLGPGPSESLKEAVLRDKLFGDMDIVVQLAQDHNSEQDQVQITQSGIKAQDTTQEESNKRRKYVSFKRKGKENVPPPPPTQRASKRGMDQLEENRQKSEPASKKRVFGEIPRNISVEAVEQPRRQQ